jgi:hypothetical protein
MSQNDEISLTADQFQSLVYHIPFSMRSLFSGGNREEPQPANRVLDKSEIQPELSRALAVMSQVETCVELILPAEQTILTFSACFPKDGTTGLGMIEDESGTITLLELEEMEKRIEKIFRISSSENSDFAGFEASLSENEAWAFAGLLDLHRQAGLSAALIRKTALPSGEVDVIPMDRVLQLADRMSELSSKGPESLPVWQTIFYLSQFISPSSLQSQNIQLSIQNLMKAGWVVSNKDGFQLTPTLIEFANQSLVATGMAYLTVRNLEEELVNEKTITSLLIASACLCGWVENENVILKGGNSSILFQMVEKTLKRQRFPSGTNQKKDARPQSSKCSSCGQQLNPGALFCPKCGTPAVSHSEPSVVCPSCGTPSHPGAQYCRICGRKIQ